MDTYPQSTEAPPSMPHSGGIRQYLLKWRIGRNQEKLKQLLAMTNAQASPQHITDRLQQLYQEERAFMETEKVEAEASAYCGALAGGDGWYRPRPFPHTQEMQELTATQSLFRLIDTTRAKIAKLEARM